MHSTLVESAVTLRAADGIEIPGLFANPTTPAVHSVLMLHGITTHKNEFGNFYGDMASSLATNGVASLRIDFRGHGDSQVDSRQFSIASQVLDATAAKDWLLNETGISKVHVIGSSFGAPPSLFLALRAGSEVATLNLICPVLDYDATFLRPSTDWARELFSKAAIEAAFQSGFLCMDGGFQIDVKLLLEMEMIRPYEILAQALVPTLIIHGEADSMVPYSVSAKYVSSMRPSVQLIGIPHMDHGFNDEDDETGQSPASRRNFNLIVKTLLDHIRRSS